ncbi:MAG: L-threonylcarbamoyladenylate synthase [Bdellovibrionota bacterium]
MIPLDSAELIKARDLLRENDVVGLPTETVYGLAANIDSHEALKKIFSLKERPFFDPLIVHVASIKQAQELTTEWPPVADFLARWFWPGPLTLVLPKAASVDPLITSGLDTVAVRFPSHPVALEIIRLVGRPLAAPSANKFGKISPSTAAHVRAEFPDLLVIDGGNCEVGLESTVIDFKVTNEFTDVRILRPGGVTEEMIRTALDRWSQTTNVIQAESSASPGHVKHHYMPPIPLAIVDEDFSEESAVMISEDLRLKEFRQPIELMLPSDPAHAARIMYSEMRTASESGADMIYVRKTEAREGGLWAAIWDRLTRAASWDPDSGNRLGD